MSARVLAAAHYAAVMHADQRRKGAGAEPYVNHVLDVARRLTEASEPPSETLLIAALLHDVVEDTAGTLGDIAARFGPETAALVAEVTDDKSLPKAERKRLQVETVPHKSADAKRLKLADKASNVAAIATHPPEWPLARKQAYLDWAEQVITGCQGVDAALEAAFHQALTEARAALARDA